MKKDAHRWVVAVLSLSLAGVGIAFGAVRASAQSALQYSIVVDAYGNVIGQLAGNGVSVNTDVPGSYDVSIATYTAAPTGVSMSTLAPAVTSTSTTVKVTVPSTTMVGFCSSGNYYNKKTGQCSDGKFPYKIVQIGALSNPASQVPNVACTAPRVATFYQAYGKWSCLVPPGFKLSM